MEYVDAICNEISYKKKLYGITCFNSIYIGGGTPSLLSDTQFKRICLSVFEGISEPTKEFTVEVNPDDVSLDLLNTLSACGVTRISCGVQTLNGKALSFVKRRSSEGVALEALRCISNNWEGDFSADLICGLPGESANSFSRTLSALVDFSPDHISMYSLTLEEGTVLGDSVLSGRLDYDFDRADELWLEGRDFLERKGYFQYEVSNFSKAGKESVHNMTYWKLQDYIGCGAGATGTLYGKVGERFTNTTDIKSYMDFWNGDEISFESRPGEMEAIGLETQEFEFFMMGLRTLDGISSEDYEKRFGREMADSVRNLFEEWNRHGLCCIEKSGSNVKYSLGKKGVLYLNAFLENLL